MNLNELEVNYHAMLMHSPDPSALIDMDTGLLLDVNARAEALWGLSRQQLLHLSLAQLCPATQPDGRQAESVLRDQSERAARGESAMCQLIFNHAEGALAPCEVLLIRLPIPGRRLIHARVVDISQRLRAEQLRDGQGRILELVARAAPLKQILDQLLVLIESQSDGVLCSILLLDEDGTSIRPISAPSLPPEYMAALAGLQIGPAAGSCGAAMFSNEIVIVPDILVDPRWAPYAALVVPHGLRACWATPICTDGDTVLGSFAMYYREVRSPTEDDMHLIGIASHLAGIAIERERRERELAQHRTHLEEMVEARTAELTTAMERADQINHELSNALDTLSLAQDELVRRDKLAALGALVAGVAHELGTPIGNSVVVATSLADRTRQLAEGVVKGLRRAELEKYLADAGEAGELLVRNLKRAATLVAGFKQIAIDQASLERRAFPLTGLLCDLGAPLRVAAKSRKVRLELAFDSGLAMESYPGPLSQVVTELFENCLVHAFPDGHGGVVKIGAALRTRESVAITVEDDGAGMTPEVQAHAFDPFFTTRSGAGSSGLGLHVAHNIVSNILGGRIDLRSEPGRGTSFTLLLPLVAPHMTERCSA
jgi:PAS domain S-box-containing protein